MQGGYAIGLSSFQNQLLSLSTTTTTTALLAAPLTGWLVGSLKVTVVAELKEEEGKGKREREGERCITGFLWSPLLFARHYQHRRSVRLFAAYPKYRYLFLR